MRFEGFVDGFVVPVVRADYDRIRVFASDLRGGWEVWLQVQIFWALRNSDDGVQEFTREPVYPGGNKKADFNFVPLTADRVTIWVELKTQRQGNIAHAIREFDSDVIKLEDNFPTDGRNTAGAIVVIPVGSSEEILSAARERLTGTRISLERYKYRVIDRDHVHRGDLFNQTGPGLPLRRS